MVSLHDGIPELLIGSASLTPHVPVVVNRNARARHT